MRLVGKKALITGGSAGIGRSAAILFSREGAKVAVNSVSNRGQTVVDEITASGGKAIFVQGHVEKVEDARSMVKHTIEAFGGLDVLVNNAGIVTPGRVDDSPIEEWDRQMAVNARGVFLVSRFAVEHMLAHGGGSIVHNASIAGVKGLKDLSLIHISEPTRPY